MTRFKVGDLVRLAEGQKQLQIIEVRVRRGVDRYLAVYVTKITELSPAGRTSTDRKEGNAGYFTLWDGKHNSLGDYTPEVGDLIEVRHNSKVHTVAKVRDGHVICDDSYGACFNFYLIKWFKRPASVPVKVAELAALKETLLGPARTIFEKTLGPDWSRDHIYLEYPVNSPIAIEAQRRAEQHKLENNTMNKETLYQTSEKKPRYGTYLATNAKGQIVLDMRGSGDVEAFDAEDIEEVVPYTFEVTAITDRGATTHYTATKGVVAKGDLLLSDSGHIYRVEAIDTKFKDPRKEFKGRKLVTERLGEQ